MRDRFQKQLDSEAAPAIQLLRVPVEQSDFDPGSFQPLLKRAEIGTAVMILESQPSGGMPSPHPLLRREAWCKEDSCRRMPRRRFSERAFPAHLPCLRKSKNARRHR